MPGQVVIIDIGDSPTECDSTLKLPTIVLPVSLVQMVITSKSEPLEQSILAK